MLNLKKDTSSLVSKNKKSEQLSSIQKLTQNHKDPELVYYRPYQHTQTQEDLYEFQTNQGKRIQKNSKGNTTRQEARHNIQLTIILVNQNDMILKKIEEIKHITNEEELKTKIFMNKIQENQKIIDELLSQKQRMKESPKIKTLNQSFIPNKSVQLNTTANTNAWINQLFNKSQLENLWNVKEKEKQRERKIIDAKIKSYTIDLSSFMNTVRNKNQKTIQKSKLNDSKYIQEKIKPKSSVKAATNRTINNKVGNKMQLYQKQALLNKNITHMRNLKKNKFNPQL